LSVLPSFPTRRSSDLSTIADNLAEGKGGGIFAQEAEVEMAATIVWRNWVKGMPSDFFLDGGTFITRGYNMFGEDDGTLGTIGGTDRKSTRLNSSHVKI